MKPEDFSGDDSADRGPAIFLIADVRGYTRFTHEQGDEAAARLAARFAEAVRQAAEARGGRVLELRADEALAVFPSARQALRAGVELQASCARPRAGDAPLQVGIGLDAGEPVPFQGGYRGEALNLAARLCALAGPGDVLASEGLVHLARRVDGLEYVEHRAVELKGLAEPVRVYRVRQVEDGGVPERTSSDDVPPAPERVPERLVEAIRVLLADDHTLFREGVASLLERTPDIQLVGEASTGEEAILLASKLLPDLVLMDLQMPGMGGIEATRHVVREQPHIGVIVLTMFEDDESVFAALKAGARGYVLKDAGRGTLLRAIRSVAQGEALLGGSIARRVLDHFAPQQATREPLAVDPPIPMSTFEELTPRELEVLRLISQGLRNREIAERLVISERTVGNHISNIFGKLQVNDRSQAILQALRRGLVKPDA